MTLLLRGVSGSGFRLRGLGCGVWGLEFGVWGLGFGVWGLGFGVWGLGSTVWVVGFGFTWATEWFGVWDELGRQKGLGVGVYLGDRMAHVASRASQRVSDPPAFGNVFSPGFRICDH